TQPTPGAWTPSQANVGQDGAGAMRGSSSGRYVSARLSIDVTQTPRPSRFQSMKRYEIWTSADGAGACGVAVHIDETYVSNTVRFLTRLSWCDKLHTSDVAGAAPFAQGIVG